MIAMVKKELTAEQKAKELKQLEKIEARIKKAGGLEYYWLKMARADNKLHAFGNFTGAICAIVGFCFSTASRTFDETDKWRKINQYTGFAFAGFGIGYSLLDVSDMIKVARIKKDLDLYGKYHPQEYSELRKFAERYYMENLTGLN